MKLFDINRRYYKILLFFICFFSLPSSLYGEAKNIPYAPDIQKVLDRGYLIVAMSSDERVPFFKNSSKENEDPQGIDVNLAKKIAKNLGVEKVVFLRDTKNFNSVVDNVAYHKADMAISKISFTYSRGTKAHYSKKYATLYKALLINRVVFPALTEGTDDKIKSIFNKPEIRIGVMKETSYVNFAKTLFPKAEIIPMEKWKDILELVINKKISAAFWDDLEIGKYIKENPDQYLSLKIIKFHNEKDTIHITTPWDSHQLSNFIELFLTTNDIHYLTEDMLKYEQK